MWDLLLPCSDLKIGNLFTKVRSLPGSYEQAMIEFLRRWQVSNQFKGNRRSSTLLMKDICSFTGARLPLELRSQQMQLASTHLVHWQAVKKRKQRTGHAHQDSPIFPTQPRKFSPKWTRANLRSGIKKLWWITVSRVKSTDFKGHAKLKTSKKTLNLQLDHDLCRNRFSLFRSVLLFRQLTLRVQAGAEQQQREVELPRGNSRQVKNWTDVIIFRENKKNERSKKISLNQVSPSRLSLSLVQRRPFDTK